MELQTEKFNYRGMEIVLDKRSREENGCFVKGELHEEPLYQFVFNHLKTFEESSIFIDVGAHVGFYSLLIQKGTAYAIEPNPKIFDILINNAYLNKNIKVINNAVLDEKKGYNLNINENFSGMTKVEITESSNKSDYVDNLFKDIKGNVRLIKIDAEGTDDLVLLGAMKTIEKFKPIIIIESLEDKNKEKLRSLGYSFDRIGGNTICKLE